MNQLAASPPSGCTAITPALEEVGRKHIWKKSDIRAVQDRLKAICGTNTFGPMPDVWKKVIVDELEAAIKKGWCGCGDDGGDGGEGDGDCSPLASTTAESFLMPFSVSWIVECDNSDPPVTRGTPVPIPAPPPLAAAEGKSNYTWVYSAFFEKTGGFANPWVDASNASGVVGCNGFPSTSGQILVYPPKSPYLCNPTGGFPVDEELGRQLAQNWADYHGPLRFTATYVRHASLAPCEGCQ